MSIGSKNLVIGLLSSLMVEKGFKERVRGGDGGGDERWLIGLASQVGVGGDPAVSTFIMNCILRD
jgi:hypothetical protein